MNRNEVDWKGGSEDFVVRCCTWMAESALDPYDPGEEVTEKSPDGRE